MNSPDQAPGAVEVEMEAAIFHEPAAAALAFTTRDPIVLLALDYLEAGKFTEAEDVLAVATSDAGAQRAHDETSEIIRRARHNYSLAAVELQEKVRAVIPDVTAEEVERWAGESGLRWRRIDGRKFFFRREPRNLFLFCEEAKARLALAGNAPAVSDWKLRDHLQAIVDEAERTGRAEVLPVRHRISHMLTIRGHTPGIERGSVVRAWLPYPQEYRQQRDVRLISAVPEPKLVAPNGGEENSLAGAPQRTVYFEHNVTEPSEPISFQVVFEFTTFAYHPRLEEAQAKPLPPDWNGAWLRERPPHIVFTPAMRGELAGILGGETNALAQARRIFRWISANLRWNAEDEYSIIPSLAVKGFTERRGDCGVLNTVLVTLCRLAGIPARWQSGFATRPDLDGGGGMHDWAEIYIAPWGWLPADVSTGSYGAQKSDDPRIADFYCGHLDSHRMIVNLDWGHELFPPKQSLRSEPADFQRGEVEVDGRNLYFDQWDYAMVFERLAECQEETSKSIIQNSENIP